MNAFGALTCIKCGRFAEPPRDSGILEGEAPAEPPQQTAQSQQPPRLKPGHLIDFDGKAKGRVLCMGRTAMLLEMAGPMRMAEAMLGKTMHIDASTWRVSKINRRQVVLQRA